MNLDISEHLREPMRSKNQAFRPSLKKLSPGKKKEPTLSKINLEHPIEVDTDIQKMKETLQF